MSDKRNKLWNPKLTVWARKPDSADVEMIGEAGTIAQARAVAEDSGIDLRRIHIRDGLHGDILERCGR